MQIDIDIFYRLQSHLTLQTKQQSRLQIVGVSFGDMVDPILNLNLAPTLIITRTNISVARIFDWGGPEPQINHHKFPKEPFFFIGERYRRMKDQKPWSGLALSRILLKKKGLNEKLNSKNVLSLEHV